MAGRAQAWRQAYSALSVPCLGLRERAGAHTQALRGAELCDAFAKTRDGLGTPPRLLAAGHFYLQAGEDGELLLPVGTPLGETLYSSATHSKPPATGSRVPKLFSM